MVNSRRLFGILLLLVPALLSSRPASPYQHHGGGSQPGPPPQRPLDEEELAAFPVADPNAALPADPEAQRLRNLRNQKLGAPFAGIHLKPGYSNVTADGLYSNSPFPKMPLIVIGQVTGAVAYSDPDGTNLHSEFAFHIETILRQAHPVDMDLTLFRWGGAIVLPSGQLAAGGVSQHRMPKVQTRYVLFLFPETGLEGYYIFTGYELTNGHAYALDMMEHCRAFDGMAETLFRQQLDAAIASMAS